MFTSKQIPGHGDRGRVAQRVTGLVEAPPICLPAPADRRSAFLKVKKSPAPTWGHLWEPIAPQARPAEAGPAEVDGSDYPLTRQDKKLYSRGLSSDQIWIERTDGSYRVCTFICFLFSVILDCCGARSWRRLYRMTGSGRSWLATRPVLL